MVIKTQKRRYINAAWNCQPLQWKTSFNLPLFNLWGIGSMKDISTIHSSFSLSTTSIWSQPSGRRQEVSPVLLALPGSSCSLMHEVSISRLPWLCNSSFLLPFIFLLCCHLDLINDTRSGPEHCREQKYQTYKHKMSWLMKKTQFYNRERGEDGRENLYFQKHGIDEVWGFPKQEIYVVVFYFHSQIYFACLLNAFSNCCAFAEYHLQKGKRVYLHSLHESQSWLFPPLFGTPPPKPTRSCI